ncbi:MAG TPA: cation-translocating P-type ATPase [Victivallales bacterium]|nr:cation-translocating P-type ATPase [Victivallales bacterium]
MTNNSNTVNKSMLNLSQENSCPFCSHTHSHSNGPAHSRSLGKLGQAMIGGVFVANSYLLSWFQPDQLLASDISAAIGALILALPIFVEAVRDLTQGKIQMNELVAIAVLASFAGGDFKSAGLICFFLMIAIIIESRTASGAQRSIEDLIKLTPKAARKIVDGQEVEVDALSLQVGDIIRIRPGENFPVDGIIVNGSSAVNQSSITGESLPIDKESVDEVFAGTQNLTSLLDVKVSKVGEDTTLGKVKAMIMAAEHSRPPIVRIIDLYAGYYTPMILMIAGLTWWFGGGNMNNVIAVLVISCPCALVLAAPSAVVAALAAASRLGILIKDVSYLEIASKIRSIVFDKTGTLTEGDLSVVKLSPVEGIKPAELLYSAYSLEANSNHPAAKAICRLAIEAELKMGKVEQFEEEHGKGVSAILDGKRYFVGRASWLKSKNISIPLYEASEEESSGMSIVYVAREDKTIGWIALRDTIRKEAKEAIIQLRKEGIRQCSLVTGDRASVAEKVAKTLEMDEIRSECLPDDKVEFVKNTKKSYTVAVVGDGINDAPALAAGDLGIAMGAIGSDIAINSASIALMTNDLRRIPMLIKLAKRSNSIINQNLIFGMLFVIAGVSFSVFGYLNPVAAAILHAGSTIVIIFNSARLVRTGEELTSRTK